MGLFKKYVLKSAISRRHDEVLYARVLDELKSGSRREGLWAKAIADCSGDEGRAKSLYIKYRVQSIKDDIEISKESERLNAESTSGSNNSQIPKGINRYEEFRFLRGIQIPESCVPSSQFYGSPETLLKAHTLSDVSGALKMLEFKLIDAVKAQLIDGVCDESGEWWISLKRE